MLPPEACEHSTILQATTDWGSGLKWVALNETQLLYGSNLWLQLTRGWIGRCTIGYS